MLVEGDIITMQSVFLNMCGSRDDFWKFTMNHSGDPLNLISVTGKNYKDEWILNIVEAGYNQPWL